MISIPEDVIEHGESAFYLEMVNKGTSPRLAEMLALQSAPRVMTDAVFFSDRGTLADQFAGNEQQLNYVINEAKKHGYTPGVNDVYDPNLANKIGDPLAFIPPTGGLNHVKKVCEARGTGCHGALEIKARQDEPKQKKLGNDIIKRLEPKVLSQEPALRKLKQKELHAEIARRHGPA